MRDLVSQHLEDNMKRGIFWIFKELYSNCFTCRRPTPLRFRCVGGCCDRTQDCCDSGIGRSDALTNWLDLIHQARFHQDHLKRDEVTVSSQQFCTDQEPCEGY
jgi:hypothetical protein